MRKRIYFLIIILLFLGGILFLNIKTTTRQCIDFKCENISIPLYLKLLDFFDRHYNYIQLANNITKGAKTDEEKVMKIFLWTHNNIKRNPPDLPIIDDHAWHIIIRRYGAQDQYQDVFTTLCNYAKINAFFMKLSNQKENTQKCFSFVEISNKWSIYDAYDGVYFRNKGGRLADIDDIAKGNYLPVSLGGNFNEDDYAPYFKELDLVKSLKWKLTRSAIQSPIRRFIYWIKGKK